MSKPTASERVETFWEEHHANQVTGDERKYSRTLHESLVWAFGNHPYMFEAKNRRNGRVGDMCLPEVGTENYELLDMFVREADALMAADNAENTLSPSCEARRNPDHTLARHWERPIVGINRADARLLARLEAKTKSGAAQRDAAR
jgi:hypothetical protein